MSTPGTVVLRRTWPQRVVIVACLGVIVAALAAAWFLDDVYGAVRDIGRVEVSGEVLATDTPPGAPVNFLLVGEDSAARLDPGDSAALFRVVDERGFNADSITVLRVDPTSGQAWVVSVPRDLLVENPSTGREVKINSTLLVGGPELLIETVSANFGIEINHLISLDFLGFREVVDQLDGIPVWFDHPARDRNLRGENASGLDIPSAGCHVLDGVEALEYVRSRFYQEFIDGEWRYVGNGDFGRIERQQDFLVLALDRAIDRGARNPTTLASLLDAGAQSIVLDDELTVSELIDVGEAFSDFNPQNLQRFGLEVTTVFEGERYLGERMVDGVNDGVFDVFRGVADLLDPADVRIGLYASDPEVLRIDGDLLEGIGFGVDERWSVAADAGVTAIIHPPGELAAAETVARYLLPTPPLVEDADADGIRVHLGADHEQVLFLFPSDVAEMRAAVAAHGEVVAPDLSAAVPAGATPPVSPADPVDDGDGAELATDDGTDDRETADDDPAVTERGVDADSAATSRIIGRPPEGESCG